MTIAALLSDTTDIVTLESTVTIHTRSGSVYTLMPDAADMSRVFVTKGDSQVAVVENEILLATGSCMLALYHGDDEKAFRTSVVTQIHAPVL